MARGRRPLEFKPSYTDTVDRVERQGSMFDSLLKDVKLYRPKVKSNNAIRIMPPTWPKPKHYGLYIKVHNNVGPKNRRYLCLKENTYSPYDYCPLCDELYSLGAKATDEDRKLLRTYDSVLYYILDKDEESEGLQVWITSSTNDTEIAAQCLNRRSKSILDITDPDNGYDLEFSRIGTTFNTTRYRGFKIVHEPSPISDNVRLMDTVLDEIFDRPLPSVLNFYSPKHIEEVFYGRAKEDNEDKPIRARDEEVVEEERPLSRRREPEPEEEPAPPPRRAVRETVVEEEEEPPRRRTRLERDLDDEIPEERTTRPRLVKEEEEEDRPRRRVRDEQPADDDEDNNRSRARMRERLDRSAE